MNITIDRIKNRPDAIPHIAKIWYELFAKQWMPSVTLEEAERQFLEYLSAESLPTALIAFDDNKPVGACCFKAIERCMRPDVTPWLGPLVVDSPYQRKGIATLLVTATKEYAKTMNYSKIHLFTLSETLPTWYAKLGWHTTSVEEFRGYNATIMEIKL